MNFSELFRQSSQLCKFSPDGKYLVTNVNNSVIPYKILLFLLGIDAHDQHTDHNRHNKYGYTVESLYYVHIYHGHSPVNATIKSPIFFLLKLCYC